MVHPLQPRFAQAITGMLALEAVVFGSWPVVPVALALIVLNLMGPRWSPVAWLFRLFAPPPRDLEPATPVRFAQILAATMLGAAIVLWLTGLGTAGWIVVGVVAVVALFSAATGFCIGCEMYRLVFAVRRAAPGTDLRAALGLSGAGPWLVVLTAPGCARCEPVARALEKAADGRTVVRVDLAARPEAAVLPVRTVPAALAIGGDGALLTARSGRLAAADLDAVAAAV